METSEPVEERFGALTDSIRAVVSETLESHRDLLGQLHQLDVDLRAFDATADPATREQLRIARKELALAEYCAAGGLYRQAFGSLRLFLELSSAAVYFSANEYERRRWQADKSDFSWSRGLDADSGILSKSFVELFAPSLVPHSARYAAAVATVYRACSQFIHGKALASETLPERPEFSSELFRDWATKARESAEAVLFLLLIRYSDQLTSSMHTSQVDALTQHFGHYREVRVLIGLADD